MRIAIPVVNGVCSEHFGRCEWFALVDVQDGSGDVIGQELVAAPPHQPGVLPEWLAEHGVQVVMTGGMGSRAQQMFAARGIEVVLGAAGEQPQQLVVRYLAGELAGGKNLCDH
jgi:ATP-binding protein involved in chromosome partitioning